MYVYVNVSRSQNIIWQSVLDSSPAMAVQFDTRILAF